MIRALAVSQAVAEARRQAESKRELEQARIEYGLPGSSGMPRGQGLNLAPCSRRRRTNLRSNGRVANLDILMNREEKPVFEAGEDITGTVALELTDTFRFKCLNLTLWGVVRTGWKTRGENSAKTGIGKMVAKKFSVSAQIDYIQEKKVLMGGMGSGARQRLPEGRHEFDFRFVLPTLDLPTSFEGCAGSVRYFLKAELEESSKLTHRSVRAFSVIGKPKKVSWELMQPLVLEQDLQLGSTWPSRSGCVQVSANIDRQIYCAGEAIAIHAVFSNISPFPIRPIAKLVQVQTYRADHDTRPKVVEVDVGQNVEWKGVKSGSDGVWEAPLLLKIPVVCPSIENCDLIEVEYKAVISFLSGTTNSSLGSGPGSELSFPLFLTSVPVSTSYASNKDQHSSEAPSVDASGPNPEGGELGPPPSYLECLDSQVDLIQTETGALVSSSLDGSPTFMPMYRCVTNYQYQAPPTFNDLYLEEVPNGGKAIVPSNES